MQASSSVESLIFRYDTSAVVIQAHTQNESVFDLPHSDRFHLGFCQLLTTQDIQERTTDFNHDAPSGWLSHACHDTSWK